MIELQESATSAARGALRESRGRSPGNQDVDLEENGLGVKSNVCSRVISGEQSRATQNKRVLGVRMISYKYGLRSHTRRVLSSWLSHVTILIAEMI